jgi:hypothetical protein
MLQSAHDEWSQARARVQRRGHRIGEHVCGSDSVIERLDPGLGVALGVNDPSGSIAEVPAHEALQTCSSLAAGASASPRPLAEQSHGAPSRNQPPALIGRSSPQRIDQHRRHPGIERCAPFRIGCHNDHDPIMTPHLDTLSVAIAVGPTAAAAGAATIARVSPMHGDTSADHGSSLLADVLVPDLGMGRDELVHELHALR